MFRSSPAAACVGRQPESFREALAQRIFYFVAGSLCTVQNGTVLFQRKHKTANAFAQAAFHPSRPRSVRHKRAEQLAGYSPQASVGRDEALATFANSSASVNSLEPRWPFLDL